MKPYYYIFNTSVGPPTKRHETLEEALKEAERLAQKQPGHAFEILQCIGTTRVANVQTFWMDGIQPPAH